MDWRTFERLSAARCVSVKDDVLYGFCSEWQSCSYKHALQFSPRCEAERLSNQPAEGTSRNEWASQPTVQRERNARSSKLSQRYWFCFFAHAETSWSVFIIFVTKAEYQFFWFFFCPFLLEHKSSTLLCIDRKLTFTVVVIYMVMKVSVSSFISSFSVSSLQRRGHGGETPPAYQDKAIWMDNTFSSTYKGVILKRTSPPAPTKPFIKVAHGSLLSRAA